MSDCTPTLAEVRRIFSAHALKSDRVRLSAEFDRFIAKVKADAQNEVIDCVSRHYEDYLPPGWNRKVEKELGGGQA